VAAVSDTSNPPVGSLAVGLPARAVQLAVLKELAEQVKRAYDAARAGVSEQLMGLHESLGVKTIEVRMPEFGVIAQITLPETSPRLAVDEELFVDWCAREHPSEVVDVPATRTVREAFRKRLLADLKVTDLSIGQDGTGWTAVDPDTGQAMGWARITPPAAPTPTFTWKPLGRQVVAQAWRNGALDLATQLTLPATDGDDEDQVDD
jgi:hypothetical protein